MSTQLVGKRSNQHQTRIYADVPENSYSAYDTFAAKIRKLSDISDTIEISAAANEIKGGHSQDKNEIILQ